MRKILKPFFIIFLLSLLIFKNTYSEEKKFSYDQHKILKSYFLLNKQIKSRNLNYNERKSHIEIRYIGTVYKDNLILIHTKGRKEYKCSYFSSIKEITKDLKKYIKK